MKKLLIGAALAFPVTPAFAGVTFLSDVNVVGVTNVVSAGDYGATTGTSKTESKKNNATISSIGGNDANVTLTTSNQTLNTATTSNPDTTGTTNTVATKNDPSKGETTTVTTTTNQIDSSTAVNATLTAKAVNSQDIASTFNSATSASFVFTGATSGAFDGKTSATTTYTPQTITDTKVTANKTGAIISDYTGTSAGAPVTTSPVTTSIGNTTGTATATLAAANKSEYDFASSVGGDVTVIWTNSASNNVAKGYTIELIELTTNTAVGKTTIASVGTGFTTFDYSQSGNYELLISESIGVNAPDYITGGGPGLVGSSTGDFNMNILPSTGGITAVPEASTWVMMLAGFASLGFAGAARNRKQSSLA